MFRKFITINVNKPVVLFQHKQCFSQTILLQCQSNNVDDNKLNYLNYMGYTFTQTRNEALGQTSLKIKETNPELELSNYWVTKSQARIMDVEILSDAIGYEHINNNDTTTWYNASQTTNSSLFTSQTCQPDIMHQKKKLFLKTLDKDDPDYKQEISNKKIKKDVNNYETNKKKPDIVDVSEEEKQALQSQFRLITGNFLKYTDALRGKEVIDTIKLRDVDFIPSTYWITKNQTRAYHVELLSNAIPLKIFNNGLLEKVYNTAQTTKPKVFTEETCNKKACQLIMRNHRKKEYEMLNKLHDQLIRNSIVKN